MISFVGICARTAPVASSSTATMHLMPMVVVPKRFYATKPGGKVTLPPPPSAKVAPTPKVSGTPVKGTTIKGAPVKGTPPAAPAAKKKTKEEEAAEEKKRREKEVVQKVTAAKLKEKQNEKKVAKEKAAKDKNKAAKEKEKEKQKHKADKVKEKEKSKADKEKEREKLKVDKDKKKAAQEKQREKDKAAKEKEREKAAKDKEKEKATKEREKKKEQATKDKEKGKVAKEKDAKKAAKEKEKEKLKAARDKKVADRAEKKARPKRPLSAYLFYSNEVRPSLAKDGAKITDVAKEIAAKWRALPDDLKKKYTDMNAKDKVRHQKAVVDYQKAHPQPPKKPHSPYVLFFKDAYNKVKAENPNLQAKELLVPIAKKWQSMSAEQKQVYNKQAAASKDKYDRELKAFEKNNPSSSAK